MVRPSKTTERCNKQLITSFYKDSIHAMQYMSPLHSFHFHWPNSWCSDVTWHHVRVLLYCTYVLHVSGPCSLYICSCLYLIWKNRPVTRKVTPRSYIESEVVHTRTSRPFRLYIDIHFYASNSSPTISEILKLNEKNQYISFNVKKFLSSMNH